MRGFEGRRIVDAVTGHGHHLVTGLQGLDDPQLLLRHHPCKEIDPANPLLQLRVAHPVEFGAGDHLPGVGHADLPGDVLGRASIVAGDHHHADAGPVALPNGRRDGRTDGICQADQTHKVKVDVVLGLRQPRRLQHPLGHPQHPQPVAGHGHGLVEDASGSVCVEVT